MFSRPVIGLGLLFLAIVAGFSVLQWSAGAYRSDLAGDPDEAAHAVTALMVRDYILKGGGSPLAFAQRYYQRFPKVALGHYPPGYYIPGALVLLPWCSPPALIALQAVFAGILAVMVCAFVRSAVRGSWMMGAAAAVLAAFQTEIFRTGCHVLSDLLLCILVFAAIWCWAAFMRSGAGKGLSLSLLFGLMAALAILTKGSALGLAGVPLLAAIMCGRLADLKAIRWWASALPVVVLAAPWMWYSVRFTAEGFVNTPPAQFFPRAVAYYARTIPQEYGWLVAVLLVVSLGRLIFERVRGSPPDAVRGVLWAGWISMQMLIMLVPTGLSPRYLLPGWPCAVILAAIECHWWVARLMAARGGAGESAASRASALTAVTLLASLMLGWRDRPKIVSGYGDAVARLLAARDASGAERWLVSADPRGEGAVIAAAAFGLPQRCDGVLTIHRGTKEIVDSDWLGQKYETRFASASDLRKHLEKLGVSRVLVDLSLPAKDLRPHVTSVAAALREPGSGWALYFAQPVVRSSREQSGDLLVFQREEAAK